MKILKFYYLLLSIRINNSFNRYFDCRKNVFSFSYHCWKMLFSITLKLSRKRIFFSTPGGKMKNIKAAVC